MSTLIKIKYADNFVQPTEADNNTNRTSSDIPVADRELLVNTNSNLGLIMDYIRECSRVEGEIDLWEESTGQLKNIGSHKPHVSGLEIFRSNSTYIVIIIERDSNGQIVNYVPMTSEKPSRALAEILSKTQRLSKRNSVSTLSSSKLHDKAGRKKSQAKLKQSGQ